MMTKRRISAFLLLCMLCLALTSCFGSSQPSGTDTTTQKPYTPDPISTSSGNDTQSQPPETSTLPSTTVPDETDPIETTTEIDPPETEPSHAPSTKDLIVTGTLTEDTGTHLVLFLDWTAEQKAGSSELHVTCKLRLQYYAMYKSASYGTLTANGHTVNFISEKIDDLESDQDKEVILAETSFTVDRYDGETVTFDLEGKWYYGGVYSDQEFEWITVSGTAVVSE